MDIPPHGLILNSEGYAVPSPSVISTVQVSFCKPPLMVHIPTLPPPCHDVMVQIPSPMNTTSIVPPSFDSTIAGLAFRKSGSSRHPNVSNDNTSTLGNASGTILMVNGLPING